MFSLIFPFLIHAVCGTTGYPSAINFGVITWTSLSIPFPSIHFWLTFNLSMEQHRTHAQA
jgi:hypothetical protein